MHHAANFRLTRVKADSHRASPRPSVGTARARFIFGLIRTVSFALAPACLDPVGFQDVTEDTDQSDGLDTGDATDAEVLDVDDVSTDASDAADSDDPETDGGGPADNHLRGVDFDLSSSARFGESLSLTSERLIVGASDDTVSGWPGEAFVFAYDDSDGWPDMGFPLSHVTATTEDTLANFGYAVSAADDDTNPYVAVGVPSVARVFVYSLNAEDWELEHTIEHPDADTASEFGAAVWIGFDNGDNPLVVVGAPAHKNTGASDPRTGAVFVYQHETSVDWDTVTVTTIVPVESIGGQRHGSAVSVNSVLDIVVGTPGAAAGDGAVFMYGGRESWDDEKPAAGDADDTTDLGSAVWTAGPLVAVGGANTVKLMELNMPEPSALPSLEDISSSVPIPAPSPGEELGTAVGIVESASDGDWWLMFSDPSTGSGIVYVYGIDPPQIPPQ